MVSAWIHLLIYYHAVVVVHAFSPSPQQKHWSAPLSLKPENGGLPAQQATDREAMKSQLLELIASSPSNVPTSKDLTDEILQAVQKLEEKCPTDDVLVLDELPGNWELLWTAQDQSSSGDSILNWINPLENQSYSNNPSSNLGRANPVLPRLVQDQLEKVGLIVKDADPVRSSQAIDLRRNVVRNVVGFTIPSPGKPRKATLTGKATDALAYMQ